MKIHHIGYAVKNIEEAIKNFKDLGYKTLGILEADEKRKVKIQFMQNDNYTIELISPSGEDSPIKNILTKIGNTPYHFCYEVENIERTIQMLKRKKYLLVENISPAKAINNQKVAFLFNNEIGLIELLEKTKESAFNA